MKTLSSRQIAVPYLILHLLSCWSSSICQATVRCPERGWSCTTAGGEWKAISALPDTEGVAVTYGKTKIHIDCQQFSGAELKFPKGFLKDFKFNSTEYQFNKCPVPVNQTFADILYGNSVQSLLFSANTPLGDHLNEDIFNGLVELQSLSITESSVTTLPVKLFSYLTKLIKIDLKNNQLTHLPHNTFAAIKGLKYLQLSGNNFTEMTETLAGLENLEKIYLYQNQIKLVSRKFFASMPMIKIVDLQDNQLTNLTSDLLHDVPLLEYLKLFKNHIQEIPLHFLQFQTRLIELDISDNPRLSFLPSKLLFNLTSLRDFNLNRCNLQKLPATFFQSKQLFSLGRLQLSRNKLAHLQPGLFRDLGSLETLNLDYNQFTELSQGVFNGLEKLSILNLAHNELTAIHPTVFASMTGLKELYLSWNNLSYAVSRPFELPQPTDTLDLSHNRIESLPCAWLRENLWLKRINLSYNFISKFDLVQCQSTSNNLVLDLTNNLITTINLNSRWIDQVANSNTGLTSESSSSPKVLLGYNPFHCDCNTTYLLNYYNVQYNKRYPYVLDIKNLRCKSPKALADQEVVNIKLDQMICEIDEKCPSPCSCVTHANGSIEVDCHHHEMNVIPNMAPYNTSILRLDQNNLNTLAGLENPCWANVTRLNVSSNQISNVNVSMLPKNLKYLNLRDNRLSGLTKESLKAMDARPNMTVLLQANPWSCKCEEAQPLKTWLYENAKRIGNMSGIRCNSTGQPLHLYNVCPIQAASTKKILVGATIVSLVLAIGLATVGIGYYRYRQEIKIWLYSRHWCLWFVTENEIDRDKTYDAFVSFSQEDVEFVAHHLLPGLEHGEPSYKVCIHHRDWLAGEWIPDQIIRSVQDSRRTIVVLSKNFIRSVWGRLEFKAAHHQALQDQKNRIIIIVFGDLPPHSEMDPELRMYIKFNTYLKWGDPWFWQKIRFAMPHSPISMPPLRSSSTLSHLSSSMSEEPRPMTLIGSSVLNGISEDKLELV